MLQRLSYPSRWCDLVPLFGRTEPELSIIFNQVSSLQQPLRALEVYLAFCFFTLQIIDDVYDHFKDLLTSLDMIWLNPESFSAAVYAKGALLQNCWGFIDGTARPIARPKRHQRIMFSGRKRIHCVKFQVSFCTASFSLALNFSFLHPSQCVVAPNGLIAHMFGPIEGRRHDAFMLGASGLAQKLHRFNRPNGQPYVIYGDPAYGVSSHILAPYRGSQLSQQQADFNKAMSKVRVSVEWTFGKVCQYFSYIDFKRNQKVLLQPVAKYYLVASLLTNCHTCLYGSLTSTFFDMDRPTLATYSSNS